MAPEAFLQYHSTIKEAHTSQNEFESAGQKFFSQVFTASGGNVAVGSFTSLPRRAKSDVCPLLLQERPIMVRRSEHINATPGHPPVRR